jgi:hypothetical protein
MFCAQCGNKIQDGARFCAKCGSPAKAPEAPSQAQPFPVRPQASAPPPAPTFAPPQAPPRQPFTPPAAPPQPSYAPPPPPVVPMQSSYVPPAAPAPQPGYQYPPPPYQQAAAEPDYSGFATQDPLSAASGPMPPNMHWAVVMILSVVTCGLGGVVWTFKEAFFVKKIDPSSKSVMMLTIAFLVLAVQVVISLVAGSSGSREMMASVPTINLLLNLVFIVAQLTAVFSMRSSLVRYYNSVENIGLKLSGVMTFFFSVLYFQYHFSRIVEIKQRGA